MAVTSKVENENVICPLCGTEYNGLFCPKCGTTIQSDLEIQLKREHDIQLAEELYDEAVHCIRDAGFATTSMLMRRLKVSYAVASLLMDSLDQHGELAPENGSSIRKLPHPPHPYPDDLPPYQIPKNFDESLKSSDRGSTKGRHLKSRHLNIDMCDSMEGHDFEYTCAKILKANGYSNVEVTKASGDYGIDVLAAKDGKKYAIQCKCYSSPVGNHAVQEAYSGAAYYGGFIPVVMTNQTFTEAALNMASTLNVQLWDRHKVQEMIAHYNQTSPYKRAFLRILKFMFGSISSFLSTLMCLYALTNSIKTGGISNLPINIFYCIVCWFIFKAVFSWIGKKLTS